MKLASNYFFDSCLRNLHEGYRLFSHIKHSTSAWKP
jgi:hypothetical protein